ncbi:MAG: hypothetical protein L3J42_05245, partial [Hydrogenimonas sp.]|nr:hypothetical protein [Hydrogenimonas sp.]
MRWLYPVGLATALMLGGCGSSSTSDTATTARNTGIFVDSPVDGLIFEGDLGSTGVTNNGGLFIYKNNETITFRLGNVIIGDVKVSDSDPIVTPRKIVEFQKGTQVDINDTKVLAIAKMLISADIDNDPTNGIEITEETLQKLLQKPAIRLDENEIDDATIANYLEKDETEIYSDEYVITHLEESENEIENDEYDDDLEKE